MGAKLSKHFSSSNREEKPSNPNDRSSRHGLSIVEFMKPECLKTRNLKNEKKRQLQQPEKKITKMKKLTLEDWLLASPGPGFKQDRLHGGELYAFKHFSKRVHPSATGGCEAVPCTPRDSLSVDVASAVNSTFLFDKASSTDADSRRSSLGRSESGKSRKRVSFKLPEEADIIVFHSPEETVESD